MNTNLSTSSLPDRRTAEDRRHPARRNRASGASPWTRQADRKGEFFEIVRAPGCRGRDRRPRCAASRPPLAASRPRPARQEQVPLRHDERHWFVRIPETAPVGTVRQAKEALKPAEGAERAGCMGLRPGPAPAQERRFVRQGECFFLPVP